MKTKVLLKMLLDLVRRLSQGRLGEDDALSWMILLHTHRIVFRPALTENQPLGPNGEAGVALAAQTQRGAAQVIASVWPDRDDERAHYIYWLGEYNTRTPYEVLEDVPHDYLTRVLELRRLLAQEPAVAAVEPEDP